MFYFSSGSSSDCIIAEAANNYNKKTVPCSSQASYLCEAWSPPCPDGYTWVSDAGNASCFRVRSGGYKPTSLYWHSVTTAEKICMEDGTRLASPDLEMSFSRVMSFLKNHNALFEAAGEYLTFYQFWLGYRKQKQSFQSLDIIKVAYPWYSNASLYLNVSTYINPFLGECLTSGSMGSRGGYNCSTAAVKSANPPFLNHSAASCLWINERTPFVNPVIKKSTEIVNSSKLYLISIRFLRWFRNSGKFSSRFLSQVNPKKYSQEKNLKCRKNNLKYKASIFFQLHIISILETFFLTDKN